MFWIIAMGLALTAIWALAVREQDTVNLRKRLEPYTGCQCHGADVPFHTRGSSPVCFYYWN
jgi:galactokinase